MKRSSNPPPVERHPVSPLTVPARTAARRPKGGMSRWRAVQREQFEKLIAPPSSPGAVRSRRAAERKP